MTEILVQPTVSLTQLPWLSDSWQQWHRTLSQGKAAHGWLIAGADGIGKRSFSEAMAQSLLCESHNGCGQCRGCLLLKAGNHPDRFEIAPDGKQIKVEQIRALISELSQTANQGGARVVVIQRAETMNLAAANALLKTLEEPMPGVYLVLVTSSPKQLLATIHSRCQALVLPSPTLEQSRYYLSSQLGDIDLHRQLRVFGGPLALKVAMDDGDAELASRCRMAWRESLQQGVLHPALVSLEPAKASLALKVLYIELVEWQRQSLRDSERWHLLSQRSAELYQRLVSQSGLNHVPLFQELIR